MTRGLVLNSAMHIAFFAASAASFATLANAQQAQAQLDTVLHDADTRQILSMRAACATGSASSSTKRLSDAGFNPPSTGAWCITVLTRVGRDNALGYVRDPSKTELMPALAFDNGFVGGYLKREEVPPGAPDMAALLPMADRCLDQHEPNTTLCDAVGHVFGARAARGEVMTLP